MIPPTNNSSRADWDSGVALCRVVLLEEKAIPLLSLAGRVRAHPALRLLACMAWDEELKPTLNQLPLPDILLVNLGSCRDGVKKLLILSGTTQGLWAAEEEQEDPQLRRLFYPTRAERASEKEGKIHIYQRVKDKDVLRAMDDQFHRIDAMMFTSVVQTDHRGAPMVDPDTGEEVVEEDDCDD